MENTDTHHNCGLLSGTGTGPAGQRLLHAGRAWRNLLGLPSSGLLAGFLNTHLAAGEVRGAKSAEPSSWTYNSTWARPGWTHQFV